MPRYKPVELNGLFIAVVLEEQIQPGSFEFALSHLVDEELDVSAPGRQDAHQQRQRATRTPTAPSCGSSKRATKTAGAVRCATAARTTRSQAKAAT